MNVKSILDKGTTYIRYFNDETRGPRRRRVNRDTGRLHRKLRGNLGGRSRVLLPDNQSRTMSDQKTEESCVDLHCKTHGEISVGY